jgi:hypothetical protein
MAGEVSSLRACAAASHPKARPPKTLGSSLRCLSVVLALVLPVAGAWARDFEVVNRPNLEFVQHDGTNLAGALYLPKGLDKAPVVIAVWRAVVAFGPMARGETYRLYEARERPRGSRHCLT